MVPKPSSLPGHATKDNTRTYPHHTSPQKDSQRARGDRIQALFGKDKGVQMVSRTGDGPRCFVPSPRAQSHRAQEYPSHFTEPPSSPLFSTPSFHVCPVDAELDEDDRLERRVNVEVSAQLRGTLLASLKKPRFQGQAYDWERFKREWQEY